jgi:hypothetical protein
LGTPVGFVGGPCETVEIGTGHESIMPEPRAELSLAPARPARYRREYLGWGVFVLMER